MAMETSVVMTLAFYPRGGSAQVARYLASALGQCGTSVTLCSGSLGPEGSETNARTFFAGLNVESVDFTAAVDAFAEGRDPMAVEVPIHPSFEDRPDVPDRVFADLDEDEYRSQVAPWSDLIGRVETPDVYHVHHLTHVNEAVRVHDQVPVIVHLHGTELKMLSAIRDGMSTWAHADAWSKRLIAAARRADRLISISPADRDLAVDLLGVSPEVIEIVPNGVDLTRFSVEPLAVDDRMARWTEWLVDEPRGWDESGVVGSVAYTHAQVRGAFTHLESGEALPVFLFVGRFLHFKRVPLLVRAYAAAREALGSATPPLVIWGGHPGEWEGDHPHAVAAELGVEGVFFAGWRGHDDLSVALNCADALVAPSVDEPFGQVYLEAMASGLAVIGTQSGGPPSFINTDPGRPDGWLVEPDSQAALTEALIAAAGDMTDTRTRGRNGRSVIERDYDWLHIAERVARIYSDVAANG